MWGIRVCFPFRHFCISKWPVRYAGLTQMQLQPGSCCELFPSQKPNSPIWHERPCWVALREMSPRNPDHLLIDKSANRWNVSVFCSTCHTHTRWFCLYISTIIYMWWPWPCSPPLFFFPWQGHAFPHSQTFPNYTRKTISLLSFRTDVWCLQVLHSSCMG